MFCWCRKCKGWVLPYKRQRAGGDSKKEQSELQLERDRFLFSSRRMKGYLYLFTFVYTPNCWASIPPSSITPRSTSYSPFLWLTVSIQTEGSCTSSVLHTRCLTDMDHQLNELTEIHNIYAVFVKLEVCHTVSLAPSELVKIVLLLVRYPRT